MTHHTETPTPSVGPSAGRPPSPVSPPSPVPPSPPPSPSTGSVAVPTAGAGAVTASPGPTPPSSEAEEPLSAEAAAVGLELLVAVATRLSGASVSEIDAGLAEVLRLVAEYLGADQAQLAFPPVPSPAERATLGDLPTALGQGRIREADWPRLRDGEPLVLGGAGDPHARTSAARSGGPVAIVVPVSHGGQTLAAIRLSGLTHSRPVGWSLLTLLGAIGSLLGGALVRRHAFAELAASERRCRALLDEVGSVVVHVDALGRLSYVNRAWEELTGIPAEEMIGKDSLSHVHPDDREVAAQHMTDGLKGAEGVERVVREVRFLTADDGERWMEVQGRVIRNADGTPNGFAGTLHDVTARRQETLYANAARDRAEQARERAERANAAKSEFLSRMSHELRTPLNAILGFGQLLELVGLDGEDADNLDQILRAGRHLLALINDALDVARIETGRLSLSVETVEIEPVIRESLDLLRPAAEAAGVTIQVPVTGPASGSFGRADRQRLKQILINLMSNAVKYNRPGGRVTVECGSTDEDGTLAAPGEGGWIRISVTDTGVGVPSSRIADMFLPFERLGADRTEVEGTGLGLAVTKSLVEALGGRIAVRSVEGLGTTFHVDLPAAAPDSLPSSNPPATRTASAEEPEPAHTVLYVEDNPANVTLVRRVVGRRKDVRLLMAPDGEVGLRMVERYRPSAVLLDIHLPGIDGDEVLAEIRAHTDPDLRRTPVIVVTADISNGAERRLTDAGADAFLAKPIDVRRLLAELERYLSTTRPGD